MKSRNIDGKRVSSGVNIPEGKMALLVDLAVDGIFVLRPFKLDAGLDKRRVVGGVDYVAFY
jgi:hypothetical protein